MTSPSFSRKKVNKSVVSKRGSKKHVVERVNIPLKGFVLDHLIHLFFTANPKANTTLLSVVKTFVSLVDESSYEDDHQKTLKFKLLESLTEGFNRSLRMDELLDFVVQGSDSDDKETIILDILDADIDDNDKVTVNREMSNEDIEYIANFLSQRIRFAYLYSHKDSLETRLHALRTDEFDSLEDFNNDFESELSVLNRSMQVVKVATDTTAADFSLERNSLKNIIEKTLSIRKRKSSKIRTGIQGLNTMLDGGFQSGRVYMFLGPTGGWKSGLLINSAKWYKDYNLDIEPSDPTKTTCAIYLTLENDQLETLERVYATVVPTDEQLEFSEAEVDDILDQFVDAGWCSEFEDLDEDSNTSNIKFSYKPSMSIDTSGIEGMIEELATQGFEAKFVVLDYIKRIRSVDHVGDPYIDLGSVADELSTIAKKYQIPIVTASQLNRKAIELIEEEIAKSNAGNASKKIGLQHVGESQKMLENLDNVYIINRQKKGDVLHLGIKEVKVRGKSSGLSYIAQPFVENNEMCLVEDVLLSSPVYITDLSDGTASAGGEERSSSKSVATTRRTVNRKRLPVSDNAADEVNQL